MDNSRTELWLLIKESDIIIFKCPPRSSVAFLVRAQVLKKELVGLTKLENMQVILLCMTSQEVTSQEVTAQEVV